LLIGQVDDKLLVFRFIWEFQKLFNPPHTSKTIVKTQS
jgi:hypothetical protein